jgi:hypothetical protein
LDEYEEKWHSRAKENQVVYWGIPTTLGISMLAHTTITALAPIGIAIVLR